MRWKVSLTGNRFDLDTLAEVFADSDPMVLKEDDAYYVAGTAIDQAASSNEAHREAMRLLPQLNGIAAVHDPRHQPVEIGATIVESTGAIHQSIMLSAVRVRTRGSGALAVTGGATTDQGGRPEQFRLADVIPSDDPAVMEALELLSASGPRHHSLYKILVDLIPHDIQASIVSMGWATEGELRRFTAWANSARVSGTSARHAALGREPPRSAMTAKEAGRFASKVSRHWLEWRHSHLFPDEPS